MKVFLPMTMDHEGAVYRARYLPQKEGILMLMQSYPDMELHTAKSIHDGDFTLRADKINPKMAVLVCDYKKEPEHAPEKT